MMKLDLRNPEAHQVWLRRVAALKAGSALLERKPDRTKWSRQEYRVWLYASAISRRMERLN